MAVKWDRPGSRHHGVVHYVHRDIVHDVPASQEEWRFCGQGKEKKTAPETWQGNRMDNDTGLPSKYMCTENYNYYVMTTS